MVGYDGWWVGSGWWTVDGPWQVALPIPSHPRLPKEIPTRLKAYLAVLGFLSIALPILAEFTYWYHDRDASGIRTHTRAQAARNPSGPSSGTLT